MSSDLQLTVSMVYENLLTVFQSLYELKVVEFIHIRAEQEADSFRKLEILSFHGCSSFGFDIYRFKTYLGDSRVGLEWVAIRVSDVAFAVCQITLFVA